jgi:hypothetical protein
MKIVNTITRITLINNALDRLPYDERYDEIWERLVDKRTTLRDALDNWMNSKEVSASIRIQRRHAVRLACRLIGAEKRKIMRLGYC